MEQRRRPDAKLKTQRVLRDREDPRLHPKRYRPGRLFFAVIFASSRLGCSILRSSRSPAAARRESEQRRRPDAKSKTRRISSDKRDSRLHPKRDRPGRLFFAVIFASSRLGCSILRSSRWPAAARRESEQRSCPDAKSKT